MARCYFWRLLAILRNGSSRLRLRPPIGLNRLPSPICPSFRLQESALKQKCLKRSARPEILRRRRSKWRVVNEWLHWPQSRPTASVRNGWKSYLPSSCGNRARPEDRPGRRCARHRIDADSDAARIVGVKILSKAEPEFGRGNRLVGHAAFERNLVAIRVPYMLSRPKTYVPSLASVPRCLSIFGVMTSYGLVTRAVKKDGRCECAVTRTATCWSLGSSSAYAKPESDCIQSRKPSFEWLAMNFWKDRTTPIDGLKWVVRDSQGVKWFLRELAASFCGLMGAKSLSSMRQRAQAQTGPGNFTIGSVGFVCATANAAAPVAPPPPVRSTSGSTAPGNKSLPTRRARRFPHRCPSR